MARLNKVILTGHLTADPELKQTQSGVSVTSFQIGVSRKRIKADENPPSDFFTIVAWRGTAEFITRFFKKGSAINIVGELQTRSWDDQNGNKRYATEIVAQEVEFVERQSSNTTESNPEYTPQYTPQSYVSPNFENVNPDDDLPF